MADNKEEVSTHKVDDKELWELEAMLNSINVAMNKREEASKHPKFQNMEFPPPNPKFLELKNSVELAIKNKQDKPNA
jgi:hypothetical protein